MINSTLSGRLIRWLASLSLGVLGCLCLGVFFSVKANLETQQDQRLEKLSTAIRHLFEETPGHLQPGSLEHDLDDLLKINREQGTTIIMISSELVELRSLCDRIGIVFEGGLFSIMDPDDPDSAYGLAMAGVREEVLA